MIDHRVIRAFANAARPGTDPPCACPAWLRRPVPEYPACGHDLRGHRGHLGLIGKP